MYAAINNNVDCLKLLVQRQLGYYNNTRCSSGTVAQHTSTPLTVAQHTSTPLSTKRAHYSLY